MFNDFFQKLGDEMIKACRPAKGKAVVKAAKGAKEPKGEKGKKGTPKAVSGEAAKADCAYDREKMRECLLPLVPAHLKLDTIQTVDTSGFVPRGADYLVYREYFRNLELMMNAIPSELVHGAFFLNTGLTAVSLGETLGHVADLKKLDRFSEQHSGRFIPAFVISMDMHMSYQDLKNLILDYYVSRSLDNCFEFDIMAIVNRGIVIKDWREKRSFKILDTGEDTLKWFFILINEYMDVEKEGSLELRNYIKQPVQYREY